jgi:predicted enzyme related to lactoylglutathione lyase
MPNPIIHFEIMGADSKKTQQYYADLFGWNVDSNNPMNYGIASTKDGEVGIDGGLGGTDQGSDIRVTVCAPVADPQPYLDKAVALGCKVVMGVTVIPDMVTMALFADPDGNVTGLVKG